MDRKFFVIIFSFWMVCLWSCNQSGKTGETSSQEINELPYLSYQTLQGEPASTRSLPGSSILILFNTDCDHCQREAKEISEKIDAFKNYQLLFIAADTLDQIANFSKTYNLADKPNVKFGRAEYQDVFINFGSIPTPSVYIYSRERKFVKSFLGETPVEELIKYL
jgi:thiol-disulfide isomerase/thioredoxin